MRTLISQLEASLSAKLYYLSLFSALTVPDIAGAIDSENGWATEAKYIAWYEQWVRPLFKAEHGIANPFSGEDCYRFRCSLLHQGSSQHAKSSFSRIVFLDPSIGGRMHYVQIEGALMIDAPTFCREMIAGAVGWLNKVEATERFARNYERFARYRADGIPELKIKAPIIG